MVHVGSKMCKMAKNSRTSTHSGLGRMRHVSDLDRSMGELGVKSDVSDISFGC